MNKEKVILRTECLSKIFRQGPTRINAVKEVDIEISKGERIYVHGPSGAGKSTLIDMLGGLSRPTSGDIFYNGRSMYGKMSDRKRSLMRNTDFGFVFQFYHLLPELNVLENVELPSRISGDRGKDAKEKALHLLERVGMEHRLKSKPSELSGGEAQRVVIARALVNSPEVIFCDEPTGNLDTEMRERVYELLYDISEEKEMGMVIVSHHDIDEKMFHTEYCMKDGELSFAGEKDHVLHK